ncbi:MAG TPA: peptidoglycan-binding protein [Bacillales bacterium]|nr:peptidoglycan-binding protein [Bacillales bacterium]
MERGISASIAGAVLLLVLSASASAEDWSSTYYAQQKLEALGYEVKPDGRSGPATRKALAAAGEKHGFEPTVTGLFRLFAAETVRHRIPVEDPTQMAAIEDAVKHELLDPFSSYLRNVVRHESGMVCGQVNAKNQFGAYVGWRTFMVPLMFPHPDRSGKWHATGALVDSSDEEHVNITCMLDIGIRLPADQQRELDEYLETHG